MPDAGVVEGPEQSADGDDDDESDEQVAKDLELGVDAAGLDVGEEATEDVVHDAA